MADNKIQPHKDNFNGFAHEIENIIDNARIHSPRTRSDYWSSANGSLRRDRWERTVPTTAVTTSRILPNIALKIFFRIFALNLSRNENQHQTNNRRNN